MPKPNFETMFKPPYQGVGPISRQQLEEGEREKQRKLRQYLADKKRSEKVAEANSDVPELTDNMIANASGSQKFDREKYLPNYSPDQPFYKEESDRQNLSAGLGGLSAGQPEMSVSPIPERYMPYQAPSQPQPEVEIPMAPPEPDVPYDKGFGKSLVGQRYGLSIDNEGQLPYQSPSKFQSYGLMNADPAAARTEDYKLDLPELKRQEISSSQDAGPLISTPQSSRDMLYKYLEDRRKSEPEFQRVYQDRTNDAETGRVLNTLVSGLGEMASMAGTLQGKRSDPGDMKSLPAAIYGAQRNKADELMNLRQLSNREQRGDIQMLRDLERGDLDNLRMQKLLQDMRKQRQQPKTLPYFVPGDDKTPPRMVMMDAEGQLVYQDLPPGARPTNETFMAGAPLYTQEGEVFIPSTQKSTGKTTYNKTPPGTQTFEQMKFKSQEEADKAELQLKEMEVARKSANDAERIRIDEEELKLKAALLEWKKSQSKSGKPQKDVAGETLDRAFSKDYEKYISTGGKQTVIQSLKTLKEARDQLVKMKWPSPVVGAFGQTGIDFMAPELAEVMNKVRGVVQTDLRNSLGSVFTEREGEQFMSRAFNPRASKEVNIANIDREIAKIASKAEAFQSSVDYFERNGTLRGFKSNIITGPTEPGTQNVKKQHNRQLNKTRFIYPDGRIEEKEGIL